MNGNLMAVIVLAGVALAGTVPAGDLAAQDQLRTQNQGQAQDSITGVITDLDQNEFTVQTDDQRLMTFDVDWETQVLDERGERVEVEEGNVLGTFSTGDRVMVEYRQGQGEELVAVSIGKRNQAWQQQMRGADTDEEDERRDEEQTTDSISGTITRVSASGLTLQTNRLGSMTIRVDGQTRLLDERGRQVETQEGTLLESLSSGDRVAVVFRAGEGASGRIAITIARQDGDDQREGDGRLAAGDVQREGDGQQGQEEEEEELPRTNSTLPLLAALGLLGLAGAGVLGLVARRTH